MSRFKLHIRWEVFRKAVKGELNDEDRIQFQKWLNHQKQNQVYFEKAKKYYANKDVDYPDYEDAFKEFLHNTVNRKPQSRFIYLKVAAVATVLICSGYFIFKSSLFVNKEILQIEKFSRIEPAIDNIKLILSDGRELLLDDKEKVEIPELNSSIKKVENTIDYQSFKLSKVEEPKPNTINIPKGKTMKVILSDSTVVWLNAQSSMSYLVPFTREERRVKITGEAYFEVKRNEKLPFIVETESTEVKVLGTKFNVNSYNINDGVYTTLLEGSVSVTKLNSGDNVVLKPEEQALVSLDESIVVNKVTPNLVLDWKNGLFVFDNEKLSGIFEELSRWYDVPYEFDAESLKDIKFSGYLERNNELNDLLMLFEETKGVKFKMRNGLLVICDYKQI